MKSIFLLIPLGIFIASQYLYGQQVAINSSGAKPKDCAILDLTANNKGFLLPRVDEANQPTPDPSANGLLLFNKDKNRLYFHEGTIWKSFGGKCLNSITELYSQGMGFEFDNNTNTNLTTSGDELKLDIGQTSGTSLSPVISTNNLCTWLSLNYTAVVLDQTELIVDILDETATTVLVANVPSDADLSLLPNLALHQGIRIKFTFTSTTAGTSAVLYAWDLVYDHH